MLLKKIFLFFGLLISLQVCASRDVINEGFSYYKNDCGIECITRFQDGKRLIKGEKSVHNPDYRRNSSGKMISNNPSIYCPCITVEPSAAGLIDRYFLKEKLFGDEGDGFSLHEQAEMRNDGSLCVLSKEMQCKEHHTFVKKAFKNFDMLRNLILSKASQKPFKESYWQDSSSAQAALNSSSGVKDLDEMD